MTYDEAIRAVQRHSKPLKVAAELESCGHNVGAETIRNLLELARAYKKMSEMRKDGMLAMDAAFGDVITKNKWMLECVCPECGRPINH